MTQADGFQTVETDFGSISIMAWLMPGHPHMTVETLRYS